MSSTSFKRVSLHRFSSLTTLFRRHGQESPRLYGSRGHFPNEESVWLPASAHSPRLHNLDRDQSRQSGFISTSYPLFYAISHFHIHQPCPCTFPIPRTLSSQIHHDSPLLSDTKSTPTSGGRKLPPGRSHIGSTTASDRAFLSAIDATIKCPERTVCGVTYTFHVLGPIIGPHVCVLLANHSSCVPLTPG